MRLRVCYCPSVAQPWSVVSVETGETVDDLVDVSVARDGSGNLLATLVFRHPLPVLIDHAPQSGDVSFYVVPARRHYAREGD